MGNTPSFYAVCSDLSTSPVSDHLMHGFESRWDFDRALRRLVSLWHGRIGECVGERHGHLLLRFHDTPGGLPDEEWFPRYLLQPAEDPRVPEEHDEMAEELDRAFCFD